MGQWAARQSRMILYFRVVTVKQERIALKAFAYFGAGILFATTSKKYVTEDGRHGHLL